MEAYDWLREGYLPLLWKEGWWPPFFWSSALLPLLQPQPQQQQQQPFWLKVFWAGWVGPRPPWLALGSAAPDINRACAVVAVAPTFQQCVNRATLHTVMRRATYLRPQCLCLLHGRRLLALVRISSALPGSCIFDVSARSGLRQSGSGIARVRSQRHAVGATARPQRPAFGALTGSELLLRAHTLLAPLCIWAAWWRAFTTTAPARVAGATWPTCTAASTSTAPVCVMGLTCARPHCDPWTRGLQGVCAKLVVDQQHPPMRQLAALASWATSRRLLQRSTLAA